MLDLRSAALPLVLAALLFPGAARSADLPPLDALTERISMALGGPHRGANALASADEFEFVYRRTLHEVLSDDELTADHRYVTEAAGTRVRLDIRVVRGKGEDSATLLHGGEAHLLTEGKAHSVNVDAVRSRLAEFGPDHLFSVPLALASDGRRLLGDTDLVVQEKVVDAGGSRIVLVANDDEGAETARIEVDARTYRPVAVSFRSPAGLVAYRYGDYREVAPGLIVPFEREFSRNGRTVSVTKVLRFRLKAPSDPSRFDSSVTALGPIPKVPPPPKP